MVINCSAIIFELQCRHKWTLKFDQLDIRISIKANKFHIFTPRILTCNKRIMIRIESVKIQELNGKCVINQTNKCFMIAKKISISIALSNQYPFNV